MSGWQRPADVSQVGRPTQCIRHNLTFDAPAGAQCPACALAEELRKLTGEVNQLRAINKKVIDENRSLKGIIDIKAAMAQAAKLMERDDIIWVKEKLYEYKVSKRVVLKTTHRASDGEVFANGFLAQTVGLEPDAYVCTSIGGAALAHEYDRACATHGIAQAMGLLCDALWELLPGGTPS